MTAAKEDDGKGGVEAEIGVPLFGTWRNAYVVVTASFIADVAIFYAASRCFA